jgi:hypothetical protein
MFEIKEMGFKLLIIKLKLNDMRDAPKYQSMLFILPYQV